MAHDVFREHKHQRSTNEQIDQDILDYTKICLLSIFQFSFAISQGVK